MRIQETNRILNESRAARHAAHKEHEEHGIIDRAKRMISKLTGIMRKD